MADLAELLMDNAIPILDLIVVCLNLLSILVLVWGVVKAGFDFIRFEIKAKDRMSAARENNFYSKFSRQLCFAWFGDLDCCRYH